MTLREKSLALELNLHQQRASPTLCQLSYIPTLIMHMLVLPLQDGKESHQMDPDHLLALVLEIVPDNSCLLFCPTKRYCENVALMLARLMCKHHR